jgi:hypothetical protein
VPITRPPYTALTPDTGAAYLFVLNETSPDAAAAAGSVEGSAGARRVWVRRMQLIPLGLERDDLYGGAVRDVMITVVAAAAAAARAGGSACVLSVRAQRACAAAQVALAGDGSAMLVGAAARDRRPGESKRLLVESPWSQLTSKCQRF